ncbi:MAG: hypothetical protein ACYT04_19675, partial [Nostoc sp.]
NLLPSPKIGRGAVLVRVKPGKLAKSNFYVKLTPMSFFCAPTAWSIYLKIAVSCIKAGLKPLLQANHSGKMHED